MIVSREISAAMAEPRPGRHHSEDEVEFDDDILKEFRSLFHESSETRSSSHRRSRTVSLNAVSRHTSIYTSVKKCDRPLQEQYIQLHVPG